MGLLDDINNFKESAQKAEERRRKNEKKDEDTLKWVGGFLLGMGAVYGFLLPLIDHSPPFIIASFFLLIAAVVGAYLLLLRYRRLKKYRRYQAIVNQELSRMNIYEIAKAYPTNYEAAVNDLQRMIDLSFFEGAYIDYQNHMLVLHKNTAASDVPVVNIDQPNADNTLTEEQEPEPNNIESLDLIIDGVSDAKIKSKLSDLRRTLSLIDAAGRTQDLSNNEDVRKLHELYIPKTIELVTKYQSIIDSEQDDDDKEALNATVSKTLGKVSNMARGTLNNLLDSEQDDIEVELEALQNMLAIQGHDDSDFTTKLKE